MKREIKLRHWTGEEMVAVHKITFDDDKLIVYGGGVVHFADSSTVMQYIGRKDKNKRKIYEGDILKVTSEDGESYVATVKWFGDEGYPAFDLEGIPETWNYDANALATIFQSGVETCEVIGNIFENPELLEGKQ